MNFVADEQVDRSIVERLRLEDHSVWYVAEMEPSIADDVVLDIANQQGAILLTADKDFGELVFRLERLATGIVLIRLAGLSTSTKALIVGSIPMNAEILIFCGVGRTARPVSKAGETPAPQELYLHNWDAPLIVAQAIKQHLSELTGAFTVIAPSHVRIRRLRN